MKTEAERRWQYFKDLEQDAVPERLALFRAIFDPLPPEPEAEKTLGQVLCEAIRGRSAWIQLHDFTRADLEREAEAVITAHESRRPKPSVDDVARALFTSRWSSADWDSLHESTKDAWRSEARAVFPLFGVTL